MEGGFADGLDEAGKIAEGNPFMQASGFKQNLGATGQLKTNLRRSG